MTPLFHLHIDDATGIREEAADRLINEFGFFNHHFTGHPDGYPHFEPTRHYTRKFDSSRDLLDAFNQVCKFLRDPYGDGNYAFHGYVEAEYLSPKRRIQLPNITFNREIGPLPKLTLAQLPPGGFRETEVHLTCDYERSDPEAIKALLEMGMFGALMEKPWGTSIVLTAQGSRKRIDSFWEELYTYLRSSGGLMRATLKEERIIKFWIAHPEIDQVPPVIT